MLDNGAYMPRRIAHIIIRLDTGGAEKSLQRLLRREYARSNELLHCVVCLGPRTAIGEQIEKHGIAIEFHNIRKWSLIPLWRAFAFLRRFRPDVIQGWTYPGNIAASLYALFIRSAKTAWNVRSSPSDIRKLPLASRVALGMSRLGILQPDMVLFNSHVAPKMHLDQGFAWADAERIPQTIVPNSIDPEEFRPDAHARRDRYERYGLPLPTRLAQPWVGLVGRFTAAKGVSYFLDALARLENEGVAVCGILAGPGMTRNNPQLASLLAQYGFENAEVDHDQAAPNQASCVSLACIGAQESTTTLMPSLDVLVLASLWEGTPNVLLEAMACGVTAVATRVGDVERILLDPRRLAIPGDVDSLADAIKAALQDPVQPDGPDRQRVLDHYHIDQTMACYADSYLALVD